MCSIGFAPKSGEVEPYNFTPPSLGQLGLSEEDIELPQCVARIFWDRLADDKRISDELSSFLTLKNPID